MKKYTLDEWLVEGEKRFGKDKMKWKFKCPMCGHVASIEEFINIGVDANVAYVDCIGRYTGKGSPKKGDTSGCNWVAYGFLKTCGKGVLVNGEEIFDFAEVEE
jgi:hypothetical protein